ncbi:MAG: 1-deoxy-D-xylulose-5-phosphate reductoisomerase, partial [Proteobacteria bacterium]|nr:1-deoxy-D-xylulose-5-phosphate reductoisomerase [Pseudomonadota bacterium]
METYISAWPETASLPDFPRTLSILGATGSIGTSALDVVKRHPDMFRVAALAGGKNAVLLARQASLFRPEVLAVLDEPTAAALKAALPTGYAPTILTGPEGYQALAALDGVDLVLSAIVGAAGFLPTLA